MILIYIYMGEQKQLTEPLCWNLFGGEEEGVPGKENVHPWKSISVWQPKEKCRYTFLGV